MLQANEQASLYKTVSRFATDKRILFLQYRKNSRFSHAFPVEQMREPLRRRKVNDLCHVTELGNRIS